MSGLKKGLVVQLRQNRYLFSDYKPEGFDFFLLANKIRQPSYVSLEMALYYYNIIPELVQMNTSVTTRKTSEYITTFGTFTYKSIAPELFIGYQIVKYDTHGIRLAYLEKAILDYIYFHHELKERVDFEELRWSVDVLQTSLNKDRFRTYLEIFQSQAVNERSAVFGEYIGGL